MGEQGRHHQNKKSRQRCCINPTANRSIRHRQMSSSSTSSQLTSPRPQLWRPVGGQILHRAARHYPLPLDLLSLNTPNQLFYTITSYVPTSFTILADCAWHTLTLSMGIQRSKVLIFVFDSLALNQSITGARPSAATLGDVKREKMRRSHECEMTRFKVRKGCIMFYVYAVRRAVTAGGFAAGAELRLVLTRLGEINDFLYHTTMLALHKQKTIHHYYNQSMVAV